MDVEQAQETQKFRGKLYALTEDSAWLDAGTGFTQVVGTGDARRLIFRCEESGKILHDRPIFKGDVYQLQGEGERQTIIVWEDQEDQKDWALSFQDPDGTVEIWEALCNKPQALAEVKRYLPFPSFNTLQELRSKLIFVPPSQREAFANECLNPQFLSDLIETFHSAEDLNSQEETIHLWYVVRGLFFLSNQKLTERYLREDVYEDVLGMLELDDSLPPNKRIMHRQVIKNQVKYNDVLNFEDADVIERIHLNYRLIYLKDIALPRTLDDATFASLVQMIHSNLIVILDHLQKNQVLMQRLLVQVKQEDAQSLLFLQEACRLAKQIPPVQRQVLYDRMAELGLFDSLAVYFSPQSTETGVSSVDDSSQGEVKEHPCLHHAVEVLMLHASHDPSHLRNFLTREGNESGRIVLGALIHFMLIEEDQGVQSQIMEVIRSVMDPISLEHKEKDGRLDVFYERGAFDDLVAPLKAETANSPQACFAQQLVCELVAFAISRHGYRAKVYVIRHGLAQQAARLLCVPQRFLQLAAVRVLRAIVGTKDEAYHRYLMKNGLFAPLLKSFEQCLLPPALGSNLMVSATLELLEFIRSENLKILVEHICGVHGPLLQQYAPKLKTLEGLLLKFQQNLEYKEYPPDQHTAGAPVDGSGSRARPRRMRSPGRDDSGEDDSYFESLDDDGDEERGVPTSDGHHPQSPGSVKSDGAESPGKAGLPGLLGGYEDDDEEAPSDSCHGVKGDAQAAAAVEASEVSPEVANLVNSTEETPCEANLQIVNESTVVTEDIPKGVSEHVDDTDAKVSPEKNLGHVNKRLRTSESSES